VIASITPFDADGGIVPAPDADAVSAPAIGNMGGPCKALLDPFARLLVLEHIDPLKTLSATPLAKPARALTGFIMVVFILTDVLTDVVVVCVAN
jgi:hypothetical protein